jgi:hypothetical protein
MYINCNKMYLAEDLDKVKIKDPFDENYGCDTSEIACLISKNKKTNEINYEVIIADTDLNALSVFMSTLEKRYIEKELIVILRNDNIKELLKISKTNMFISEKYLKYCSIDFVLNNKVYYSASTNEDELINANNILIIETSKIIEINNKFQNIIRGTLSDDELFEITHNNLRWLDPNEYTMDEIYNKIDLLSTIERISLNFKSDIEKRGIEKAERVFRIIIKDLKNSVENQYQYYEKKNIEEDLKKITLGRLKNHIVEKANLIHNFYDNQKEIFSQELSLIDYQL